MLGRGSKGRRGAAEGNGDCVGLVCPQGPGHRDVHEGTATSGLCPADLGRRLGVAKHEAGVAVVGDRAHEAGRARLRRVGAEPPVPVPPPEKTRVSCVK